MCHRLLLSAFLAAGIAVTCGCTGGPELSSRATAAPRVLSYTAIPDQNTTELQEKFQPLSRHLSAALGVEFQYIPSRDYQASVEMFVNGDVDLAWFGGLTGVQARERVPGARAIAQGDVDAHYYSYFIAHKSSGLTRWEQFPHAIAKYRFTFGSESSTSGRLMPEYFIRNETGKSPGEFFEQSVGFSGSHDKTAELVASGQYQVGVVNYAVFERRVREGKTDPDVVRIIWRTPEYTDYNWSIRPNVDAKFGNGFSDRLTSTLTSIADPQLLAALPRARLIPVSNDKYDAIRSVAQRLEMLR